MSVPTSDHSSSENALSQPSLAQPVTGPPSAAVSSRATAAESPTQSPPISTNRPINLDSDLTALGALLGRLDESPDVTHPEDSCSADISYQNRLVQARLGVAAGLFSALRAKHAPTALHCLRVALLCSSWAEAIGIENSVRDELEAAALLHDLGKIGVPEHVLLKPGKLNPEELALMGQHRQYGLEILSTCSPSRTLLDAFYYAPAWFDGSLGAFDLSGEQLPREARMIAIADAYDSMTTDHVYRRAFSAERAMSVLFEYAGAQFDPQLVQSFHDLQQRDQSSLQSSVAQRWLHDLERRKDSLPWQVTSSEPPTVSQPHPDSFFHQKLFDNMHDGVVFFDTSLTIKRWNRGMELLTGLPAESLLSQRWALSLLNMQDINGNELTESDCPVRYTLHTGVQTIRRVQILGRKGGQLIVDCQVIPVIGPEGALHGATLVLHDASSESTLEDRVQNLHEQATRDPLTQLANRAEFDSALEAFVTEHLRRQTPCSLLICDIDRFKSINDNYGHQAGDEAIITFATLLKGHCRTGDLVARYGGEEFVMLYADCDNATASHRAEAIRRDLSQLPQASLGGKAITASFGVTELQPGDTPETMLRRADRGLLDAKDRGRNMVVQLGAGMLGEIEEPTEGWFSTFFRGSKPDLLLARTLSTAVPMKVAVEKLRGFVADHHAEITKIHESYLVLHIEGKNTPLLRRQADRSVPFIIEMEFKEVPIRTDLENSLMRTVIEVAIRPKRNRDRRRRDATQRARQLISSIKAYLMAQEGLPLSGTSKKHDDRSPDN